MLLQTTDKLLSDPVGRLPAVAHIGVMTYTGMVCCAIIHKWYNYSHCTCIVAFQRTELESELHQVCVTVSYANALKTHGAS